MKNVLYVEDEVIVCVSMKKIWETLNRKEKLHIAHNYTEAIEILNKENIDLLITDMSLPGKSGSELIQDIRSNGLDLPIVVLSNYSKQANSSSNMVQDHYQKPFYAKDVENILKKHM